MCVSMCVSQPPLGFTPPELVGGCGSGSEVVLSGAADCFSLAALTYLLVAGAQGGGPTAGWGWVWQCQGMQRCHMALLTCLLARLAGMIFCMAWQCVWSQCPCLSGTLLVLLTYPGVCVHVLRPCTAGKELLPVGSSTGEYRSRLRMLMGSQLQGVPPTLQVCARRGRAG